MNKQIEVNKYAEQKLQAILNGFFQKNVPDLMQIESEKDFEEYMKNENIEISKTKGFKIAKDESLKVMIKRKGELIAVERIDFV